MNMPMTGALPQTRQTWRTKPVRELFAEIVAANPNATEDMLRRRFRDAAKEDPEYLDAILDYAFDAALRAYERQVESVPPTAEQKAQTATRKAAELQAHAERVEYIKEQIILLNQEMPNGKRARHCTLDYMYRLGGKFRAIGKQGSQKLVGSVYDEAAYRKKLQGVV
jgi:hypothetical protein